MKTLLKIPFTLLFTTILLLGFALPLNPVGNWYQQFMPNLNGRQIVDITFLDSLTGYAISTRLTFSDSSLILKTTDGGNNWFVIFSPTGYIFKRIQFINQTTGFVGGTGLLRTTNNGNSWLNINPSITIEDLDFENNDTGWCVYSESLTGGVFFTSNGGVNWVQQFSGGNQNPNKIYMYNARIGFMSNNSALPNIYRTTNGGLNWNISVNGERFNDIVFADSLTGWFGNSGYKIYKTTSGGDNWITQYLPTGGVILTSNLSKFSMLNKDTIWGAGGQLFFGGGRFRAMLYRSTNGGNNWLFQIPDTSYGIPALGYIQFINKNVGWAYNSFNGIHTVTGGNDTFYTPIEQLSTEVPKEFKLYQNYPNPFNPVTNIKYSVRRQTSNVKLIVYDIRGKLVEELVNQKQNAGTYEVVFSGNSLSSGIYFYSLIIDGITIETRKMALVK